MSIGIQSENREMRRELCVSPWSEIWADKHSACSLEGGLGHAMQRGGAPTVKGPRTTKRKKKKKIPLGLTVKAARLLGAGDMVSPQSQAY